GCDAQQGGRLVRVELFDVTQDEHATIARGQSADGVPHHLASLLTLAQRVARVVPLRRRLGPVPVVVEAGEEPLDRLLAAAPPAPELHERSVDDDAVEPCRQPGRAREAVDRTEGREEGFLDHIPGLILSADEPPRGREHAAAVLPDQRLERLRVTPTEAVDERLIAIGTRRRGWPRGRVRAPTFDAKGRARRDPRDPHHREGPPRQATCRPPSRSARQQKTLGETETWGRAPGREGATMWPRYFEDLREFRETRVLR